MKQRGFTLVEMLVVIAIIGILASAVLVSLSDSRKKGANAAMIRQVREYITALELAYNAVDAYPGGYGLGGGSQGCLYVTIAASNQCYRKGNTQAAYPSDDRDTIEKYIKLRPIDPPFVSSTGKQYDSVIYASRQNPDQFELYYPIYGQTDRDCVIDGAKRQGSTMGDMIECKYTSK